MTASEDQKHEQEEKYSFIEEKIVNKRKRKIKKLIVSMLKTIIMAVIFGLVSSLVFCLCGSYFREKFGKESNKKISFSTPKPTSHFFPVPTLIPSKEKTEKEEVKIIQNTVDITLKDFTKMYSLITSVATQFNQSVVTVSNVTSRKDVFDNITETTDASYGVAIANNGNELLILTSKNKIDDASSLRVTFSDGQTIEANLLGFDADTEIAILAVSLLDINESTLDSVKVATLGDSYSFINGQPVLALGSPNGYVYSMEVGIVTNRAADQYITDYKLDLYNTDIENNLQGEGVITNLEGAIIGIITHAFDDELNENINTVIGITKLKPIIEKLVNQEKQIYFGIKGNDISIDYLNEMNILNGIYVTEVASGSPAIKADIKTDDIIISINGEPVTSLTNFYNIISQYKKGDIVKVKLLRQTKENTKQITLNVELSAKK